MGCGGWDGLLVNEFVFYKVYKGYLKNVEFDFVKLCKDNVECRCKLLCEGYVYKVVIIILLYNCCDICEWKCECGYVECLRIYFVFN